MLASSCCAHELLPEYILAPQGWQQSVTALKKRMLPFASAVNAATGAAHGVFFNLANATRKSLEVYELELCSWSGAPCELTLYAVSSGDPCIGREDYEEDWFLAGAASVFDDLSAVRIHLREPVSIRPHSCRGFYLHTPGKSTDSPHARTGNCGVGNPLRLVLPGPRRYGSVGLSRLSRLGTADFALKVEPWLLSLSETPFTHIAESSKRTPAGMIIYHTLEDQAEAPNSEPTGLGQRSNSASNFLPCCAAAFRSGDEEESAWTAVPESDRAFRSV